jgi:hypothetical protein
MTALARRDTAHEQGLSAFTEQTRHGVGSGKCPCWKQTQRGLGAFYGTDAAWRRLRQMCLLRVIWQGPQLNQTGSEAL